MEEPGAAEISAPHARGRRADRGRVSGRHQYAPCAPRTSQRIWRRGRQGHREPGVAQGEGRLGRVEAVANSLEEAGDRLFTFTRPPPSQWRSARTTNAIERLHEEFKRRIKTQTVLPSADTASKL